MSEIKNTMEIVVDDGSQRVSIKNTYGNEIGVFYFKPTDLGIVDRYNKLASSFDTITEPLESVNIAANGEVEGNSQAEIEALTEATKRLYAAVDELLGVDAAGAFFGTMHPFSPVNGKFYCENALESLGKYIEAQFKAETVKFHKRVDKYTKKYGGKK